MTNDFWGLLCIVAAAALEAFGQLFLKRAADAESAGPKMSAGIRSIVRRPGGVGLGIGCFAVEMIFFSIAIRLLPISVAFPLGSLTFVFVILVSKIFLGERVGKQRIAGVALILTGATLIGLW